MQGTYSDLRAIWGMQIRSIRILMLYIYRFYIYVIYIFDKNILHYGNQTGQMTFKIVLQKGDQL